MPSDFEGFLFYWLPFSTDEFGGHVQFHTRGEVARLRTFTEPQGLTSGTLQP